MWITTFLPSSDWKIWALPSFSSKPALHVSLSILSSFALLVEPRSEQLSPPSSSLINSPAGYAVLAYPTPHFYFGWFSWFTGVRVCSCCALPTPLKNATTLLSWRYPSALNWNIIIALSRIIFVAFIIRCVPLWTAPYFQRGCWAPGLEDCSLLPVASCICCQSLAGCTPPIVFSLKIVTRLMDGAFCTASPSSLSRHPRSISLSPIFYAFFSWRHFIMRVDPSPDPSLRLSFLEWVLSSP